MNLACLADSQQERVADLLFDAEAGLGLQIVRYNIGGSNTTLNATNSMRPFAAVPSMLLANGTYNWTLVSQPALVDHIITADIDVLNATSPGQWMQHCSRLWHTCYKAKQCKQSSPLAV